MNDNIAQPQWQHSPAHVLPLDGEWGFVLAGQHGAITVPGAWEAQGYPRRIEGPAIYQRKFHIPANWNGHRIQLQFDAVSYHVAVEVNGQHSGEHRGAWSPFAFDVTDAIRPGEINQLRLTIHKPGERFPVRESLVGFLPDVMLMFGGLWQSARLVTCAGPIISELTILADVSGVVDVMAQVEHGNDSTALLQIFDSEGQLVTEQAADLQGGQIAASLSAPNPQLWSPAQPIRYLLRVLLQQDGRVVAQVDRQFGFRALSHAGEQLLFNGAPVFLRGILNWGWYPDQLCPAPDEDTIREEFRRLKALGFNLVKLCLYVPSPLYFEIADQEGMFLWLELPMWLPEVTPRLRAQAPREYAQIVQAIHHHPAVIIYSLGCELDQAADADLLSTLDKIARGCTAGALYCDNSGSGEAYGGLRYDFADFNDYHFYADLQFFEPLCDHFHRDWRPPRPWIFGEFCDADDFRDLDEIATACGGELPWWLIEWNPLHERDKIGYPAQRERMAKLDLGFSGQALQQISRQGSFAVRKAILEKVRARSGMGGYVITSIRDTPLATSSLFDDLGRDKYDPAAFRQFNGAAVLLLGRERARKWTRGGDRPDPADPYCFLSGQQIALEVILAGAGDSSQAGHVSWRVTMPDGAIYACGEFETARLALTGRPLAIGRVAFVCPQMDTALRLQLSVRLDTASTHITNTWNVWVFPKVQTWPDGVGLYDPTGALRNLDDLYHHAQRISGPSIDVPLLITNMLDHAVRAYLANGGRVLLLQSGDRPLPAKPCPFWREAIKLIYDHPGMNAFPHDGYVDMQFYGLATDWALETAQLKDALPSISNIRPLLRRLDARQFQVTDYLLEADVGAGKMIASTLRFGGGSGDQPVGLRANLAGRWLLLSLLRELLP